MTDLDEATRARIRAEEAERFKVRTELEAERRVRERPNYLAGALLNLLISGGGLMFIRQMGPGIAWLLGAVALAFIASPWIAWLVGLIGSFIHYNAAYDRLYEPQAEVAEEARRQGQLTQRLILVVAILFLAALGVVLFT
ncbi:hypothetical protein QOL99_00145 [Deinococcus sp. MIMF12]|uniref:2TM domain-containing protein n=1 Tax=Deinococcus rhizophilus TaxID=3049544 RepID=A0ABT7JDG7_9DEIO|nr:hypothetical protein [Deinococcus rhizophilus]MDL2342558.1 hypothetical protein [Deinococcus rhizophilus]